MNSMVALLIIIIGTIFFGGFDYLTKIKDLSDCLKECKVDLVFIIQILNETLAKSKF